MFDISTIYSFAQDKQIDISIKKTNDNGTEKIAFRDLATSCRTGTTRPTTDARAVPIYQTTSYVFHNSAHAAARFELKDAGNIYGRLTNPTQNVLEERLAALEGGVAALAVASGAAAVTYAFQNITCAGDHIVAAKTIYGGTYNLLDHTLPAYGVTAMFVDPADLVEFRESHTSEHESCFYRDSGLPQLEHHRHRCRRRDSPPPQHTAHYRQHVRYALSDTPYRTWSRHRRTLGDEIYRRPRHIVGRYNRRFGQIRLDGFG